ncbi:hypothetical protein [Halarchaeum sp. P4]|uniref:hypothetical protein n=1 Tax=Halarchaeum sp. P4 TaxID=3421639 RepID=UPI003EBC9ED3
MVSATNRPTAVSYQGNFAFTERDVVFALAALAAAGVVFAGAGAVGSGGGAGDAQVVSDHATTDLGGAYLAYKAYNNDLDADSALAGGSAVVSGTGTAASGAATYVSASGTAAALGAGAAATGGALVL